MKSAIIDVPAITIYQTGTPKYQEIVLRAPVSGVFCV